MEGIKVKKVRLDQMMVIVWEEEWQSFNFKLMAVWQHITSLISVPLCMCVCLCVFLHLNHNVHMPPIVYYIQIIGLRFFYMYFSLKTFTLHVVQA